MPKSNSSVSKANRTDRMHTDAVRAFRQQAALIGKDARELAETAGAVAREQVDPLRDYVVEKPLQSLLIASGVGLLLGFIFARR